MGSTTGSPTHLRVRNAREHNLRGLDVDLPRDSLVVITGVSGSGKSSLAFDTIYQEGQRRFLESLSAYARQFLGQMERPEVDAVEGLSPTLCIDQKTVNRNPRSTVGTITEIYDHLRLLYARLGVPRCPVCLRTISRQSPGELAARLVREEEGRRIHVLAPMVRERKGEYRKELDDWRRDGWLRVRIDGEVRRLDEEIELARYEKHTLELVVDRLLVQERDRSRLVEALERALRMSGGLAATLVEEPDGTTRHAQHAVDRTCPEHGISIPEMEPRLFSFNAPQGACGTCSGLGMVLRLANGVLLPCPPEADPVHRIVCPSCKGRRLNAVALAVAFRGRAIDDLTQASVEDCGRFFGNLVLEDHERVIGAGIVHEIHERLRFLGRVGLGYLALDRPANTLSGGEAQRIRLAACVGSGLEGVTYVLDEPSIGLHPRDNRRMLGALEELRDAGNTVLVVEHDRETMELADHVVDIGPGAGRLGGTLVGEGPPAQFRALPTPTARYLREEEVVPIPTRRREGRGHLRVRGARLHNLQGVDLDLPLGTLTVLTGVSGSGKSTLLFDVLEPHLAAALADPEHPDTWTTPEGSVLGCRQVDKIIEISQAPIGRTPRSNPATYVGAFDLVRDLFASLPLAQARGFAKGRFSFNVPGGRCEACQGAGVRTIEMQFLADVEIPCETCGGRRFNPETLEITWKGRTVADVLDLTVGEALELFANHKKLKRILETMHRVGLDYVKLGQPATTLSGGEAQRLKLATELHRPPTGRTLYLLDEPTTGLHFQDVRILVEAVSALVETGNTVVVIEHNTDFVAVADHLVEMGPEGGAGGGRVLATGTPEVLARTDTPTGRVLAQLPTLGGHAPPPPTRAAQRRSRPDTLAIRGARCHNLRGIDVDVPHGKLTVVTGVSGSGKTSLAFDTVFAEGQRRYVECLSTYARRFLGRLERAPVDSVEGLLPAIAIDQRSAGSSGRSTVATVTELHDYFRLLWANLGVPHCPVCDREVRALDPSAAADWLAREAPGRGRLIADLVAPTSAAALRAEGWARGWDGRSEFDLEGETPVRHLVVDRVDPATAERARLAEAVTSAYALGGRRARFLPLEGPERRLAARSACPDHGPILATGLTPRHFSFNHWLGACKTCDGLGRLHESGGGPCPDCKGGRLQPELLAVRFAGRGIAALAGLSVADARAWFEGLALDAVSARIADQPLQQIRARLRFLDDVGLGYLALGRSGDTLSGGEAQRIRLASQLGAGLCGVLYVLDEPTVGLHPRDTDRLVSTLLGLRDLGNTLLVVEHDPDTIRRADHVLDMGRGAGELGGTLVAAGPPDALGPDSVTGPWLAGTRTIQPRLPRKAGGAPWELRGLTLRTLRKVKLDLPSGVLIAVTGVSGSGKSTLVMDGLVGLLEGTAGLQGTLRPPDGVVRPHVVVDQTPIGRSPRSTPATYGGVMDPLRALFAETTTARAHGWGISRFSYNTAEGACRVCGGYGHQLVEMHFLSNVWTKCDACRGRRYAPETLEARWKGLSIADVLDLRVDDARALFDAHRSLARPLQALVDVGLGYLRLGQPATELSGGEAQRVKLACGLAARAQPSLYVLDEPTTGLHLEDVARLVQVFDRLVDAGHTVLVVEHHLDVIRHADLVVELGPEAGDGGGRIVARGTPEQVQRTKTWTGHALRAAAAR